jgi:hypothetical protein
MLNTFSMVEVKNNPRSLTISTTAHNLDFATNSLAPMDRAIATHRNNCKLRSKCPCERLDKASMEDKLRGIDIFSEDNKPWIRTKLKEFNPRLKNMVSWVDIVNAVAQVNPILGQVSGLVTVALKVSKHPYSDYSRNLPVKVLRP